MTKILFPIGSFIMGAKTYTEAKITAMESNQRVAWKAAAPGRKGYIMKATWEIALEPQNGNTKVTQRFHFMPQHPMTDRMANDDLATQIKEGVTGNLAKLKAILEQ